MRPYLLHRKVVIIQDFKDGVWLYANTAGKLGMFFNWFNYLWKEAIDCIHAANLENI